MNVQSIGFRTLFGIFAILTIWRGILFFESNSFLTDAKSAYPSQPATAAPSTLAARPELSSTGHDEAKDISPSSQIANSKSAMQLYEPQPDDFRSAYQADDKNSAKQSWQVYYGWILAFYHGNFMTEGWTSQGKRLISRFSDEQARGRVTASLNRLGREIAQQWSKDKSAQRVDNNDLMSFARQIDQAVQKSDSSGAALCATLDKIEQVVASR